MTWEGEVQLNIIWRLRNQIPHTIKDNFSSCSSLCLCRCCRNPKRAWFYDSCLDRCCGCLQRTWLDWVGKTVALMVAFVALHKQNARRMVTVTSISHLCADVLYCVYLTLSLIGWNIRMVVAHKMLASRRCSVEQLLTLLLLRGVLLANWRSLQCQ